MSLAADTACTPVNGTDGGSCPHRADLVLGGETKKGAEGIGEA